MPPDVLREEQHHFVARGDRGEFRVSKSRLRPATVDRWRGMCRGGEVEKMASGGSVRARVSRAMEAAAPGRPTEYGENLKSAYEAAGEPAEAPAAAPQASAPSMGPSSPNVRPATRADYLRAAREAALEDVERRFGVEPKKTREFKMMPSHEFGGPSPASMVVRSLGRGVVPGADYAQAAGDWIANPRVPYSQHLEAARTWGDIAEEEYPRVSGLGSMAFAARIPWSKARGALGAAARVGQGAALTTAGDVGRGEGLSSALERAKHGAGFALAVEALEPWTRHLVDNLGPGGLDAMRRHPVHSDLIATRGAAREVAASAAHQKAIFDLERGETIPVPGSGFGTSAGPPVLSPEQAAELERALAAKAAAKPGLLDRALGAVAGAGPTEQQFTAYHGSSNVFDRPSLAHVGEGEGAAAYGHGVYATSKPEIAEHYRKAMVGDRAGVTLFGKPLQHSAGPQQLTPGEEYVARQMAVLTRDMQPKYIQTPEQALSTLHTQIPLDINEQAEVVRRLKTRYLSGREAPARGYNIKSIQQEVSERENLIAKLRDAEKVVRKMKPGDFKITEPGAVYKWNVPDELPMLDWTKKVSEQSPGVQKALAKAYQDARGRPPPTGQLENYAQSWSDLTGKEAYYNLAARALQHPQRADTSKYASSALRRAGIHGHSYVGETSGEKNYVLYDPERDVQPTERYTSLAEARKKNPHFAGGGEVPGYADGAFVPPATMDPATLVQPGFTPMAAPAPLTLEQVMAGPAPAPSFDPEQAAAARGSPAPSPALSTYTTDQVQAALATGQLAPSDQAMLGQELQARQAQQAWQAQAAGPSSPRLMASHERGTPSPDMASGYAPPRAPNPMDPFKGILAQMQPPAGALKDVARAETQRYQAEADAARAQQAWAQNQMKWYQDAHGKIDADYQATVDDYRTAHIDPGRVFRDKSVPKKAAAMIGMLFSGIGGAFTGQPNVAAQMIQRQIELDVEAQVREMDKKANLVRMNFERYGNLDQAVRATFMQQAAFYEAKIHEYAATSNAAQAKPRAQLALYQLRQPLIPVMAQIAQYQGLQNFIRSGGHAVGNMPPPMSWEQYQATAMPGPGGKTTFARSPEDRKAAVEGLQKWDAFGAAVEQLDQHRAAAAVLPVGEAQHEYEQYKNAVTLQLANAMGVGRGEALKLVEGIVPGRIDQFMYGSKSLDALRQIGANGKRAIWSTHGSIQFPQLRPLH